MVHSGQFAQVQAAVHAGRQHETDLTGGGGRRHDAAVRRAGPGSAAAAVWPLAGLLATALRI